MSGYIDFARYYDLLTDDVPYRAMADFITEKAAEYGIGPGTIAVDLGCGTGSLAIELSCAGFDMIGVDSSPMMLNLFREKLDGQQILLLCQELTELDLFGTVGLFTCTLDTVNHLNNEKEVSALFSRAGLFCESGGLFIFDVNTPYKHREVLSNNTFVYDRDEVFCVWQNAYEKGTGQVDISLDLFGRMPDGAYQRFSEEFSEHCYEETFIINALEKAGFEVLMVSDGYTERKPCGTSERLCFTARKR